MNPEELNRFLASVRKTRFVDYLDPMGESAHQALERRLKWAARSRHDPAHADEAEFLLRHAAALRQHLSQEQLDHDEDWIESADAGSEWVGGFRSPPSRSSPGADRRVAPPSPPRAGASAPGASAPRAGAPASRAGAPSTSRPGASAPRAGAPSTPRPGAPGAAAKGTAPKPASPSRSAPPSMRPAGRPPTGDAPPPSGIMRLEDLTDPPTAPRLRTPAGAPPGGPRAAADRAPRPPRAPEPAATDDAQLPDELLRSLSSRRVQSPSYTPAPALRSGLEEHEWVDPAERTPAPAVARSVPSPVPARPRTETPTPEGSPRRALDIRASRSGTAAERERATRPERGPRAWVVLGAAAVAMLAVGALIFSGALTAELEDEPEERVVTRPPVVEPAPAPEPEPADEDALASAEEHPDDQPGDGVAEAAPTEADAKPSPPAPAPETVARRADPAPAPEPVAQKPPPAPKPDPAPKPEPKPAPTPKPEPKPEQVAQASPQGVVDRVVEPPAPVTYPTLTGMWIGLAASKSFQLEIDSQSGGSFSGVAQVMNDAGGWDELRILGNVAADGSLRFSQIGGGASFSGTIDGIRASGTVKLTPNSEPAKWSVIK